MHRPWSENQFDGAEPVDCPPATRRLTDHYSVKNITGCHEYLPPRARGQILWFVGSQGFLRGLHRRMCKTGFARRALTGNGMRCARRGRGRFVQTTENPAGSPGAARGRVLLCKLIVKTCPQITVKGPVSASSILDGYLPGRSRRARRSGSSSTRRGSGSGRSSCSGARVPRANPDPCRPLT